MTEGCERAGRPGGVPDGHREIPSHSMSDRSRCCDFGVGSPQGHPSGTSTVRLAARSPVEQPYYLLQDWRALPCLSLEFECQLGVLERVLDGNLLLTVQHLDL